MGANVSFLYTDQLYARLCELEDLPAIDPETAEEIEELNLLREEIGREHFDTGVTLIPEDEFEDYAREFASDIGAIPDTDDHWPCNHINWERAAEELATDYQTATHEGTDYLYRL